MNRYLGNERNPETDGHRWYDPEKLSSYDDGYTKGLRDNRRESAVITAVVGACCFVLGFFTAYVVTWGL